MHFGAAAAAPRSRSSLRGHHLADEVVHAASMSVPARASQRPAIEAWHAFWLVGGKFRTLLTKIKTIFGRPKASAWGTPSISHALAMTRQPMLSFWPGFSWA